MISYVEKLKNMSAEDKKLAFKTFIEGHDPEERIVNVVYDKRNNRIIKYKQDENGKLTHEYDRFTSFMWMQDLQLLKKLFNFYNQSSPRIKSEMDRLGITIENISIDSDNERYRNGYNYFLTCKSGFNNMVKFFNDGGIDPYSKRALVFFDDMGYIDELHDNYVKLQDQIEDKRKRRAFQKILEDFKIDVKEVNDFRGKYVLTSYKLASDEALKGFSESCGRKLTDKIHKIQDFFVLPSAQEQYLIATGKRLFKGMTYDKLNKLSLDIETTGLDPKFSSIESIGIKTTFGEEHLFNIKESGSELNLVQDAFRKIHEIKPAVIITHNGFSFDYPFIDERLKNEGFTISDVLVPPTGSNSRAYFANKTLKLGGETESYKQLVCDGYSIVDTAIAGRRAMAINSELESYSLKYLAEYNGVAGKDRVYIRKGDSITEIENSKEPYYFNESIGLYFKNKPVVNLTQTQKSITDYIDGLSLDKDKYQNDKKLVNQLLVNPAFEEYKDSGKLDLELVKEDSKIAKYLNDCYRKLYNYADDNMSRVSGEYIIKRYLLNDVDETLKIDNIYNQPAFMIAKLVPITLEQGAVSGNASLWNKIMIAWSYENKLPIPLKTEKRTLIGGLSRLTLVGYVKNIMKCDFASLYPSLELLLDLFPDVDVSGILKSALGYFHSERFAAKNLSKKYKKEGDYAMAAFYDALQLPIKILINSFFGGMSAPDVFYWADIKQSELTTTSGRQYLRSMLHFFMKHGYKPVLMDTDGVNFSCPEEDKEYKYIGKGLNYLVEKGKEYVGYEARVAEYNDIAMRKQMGLALEKTWPVGINFARKNYALMTHEGKITKTGASIKNRKASEFEKEFVDTSLKYLLAGDGYGFVKYYYDYIKMITDRSIPIYKIINKSKVKCTVDEYLNRGTNKNGQPLPMQIHMELIIKHGLKVNKGDYIYYINTGKTKSAGDSAIDKATGDFNAKYVPSEVVLTKDKNFNINFNVPKYIDAINKKVENFLTVFDKNVRDRIIIKKPVEEFTWLRSELELVSGQPLSEKDQDDIIRDVFTPEDREIEFWRPYNYNPDIWGNKDVLFELPFLEETFTI